MEIYFVGALGNRRVPGGNSIFMDLKGQKKAWEISENIEYDTGTTHFDLVLVPPPPFVNAIETANLICTRPSQRDVVAWLHYNYNPVLVHVLDPILQDQGKAECLADLKERRFKSALGIYLDRVESQLAESYSKLDGGARVLIVHQKPLIVAIAERLTGDKKIAKFRFTEFDYLVVKIDDGSVEAVLAPKIEGFM